MSLRQRLPKPEQRSFAAHAIAVAVKIPAIAGIAYAHRGCASRSGLAAISKLAPGI